MLGARSLKQRISAELTRIIRAYVIVITVLLAVITLLAGYYFKLNQLAHHRELVSTKLSAELANAAHEMQSLADSPLLWNGLVDSPGRDDYLWPLLARFNRSQLRQFLILDYRGRILLAPDLGSAEAVLKSPAVFRAFSGGADSYGMVRTPGDSPTFVLVKRVFSPESPEPVGFIVATLDAGLLVKDLQLGQALVSVAIGGEPLEPPPRGRGLLQDEVRLSIGSDEPPIELHLWLAHQFWKSLLVGLLIVMSAFFLGLLTLQRVASWAQRFSASTTERLDQLVVYCQKIIQGQAHEPVLTGPEDEISNVVATLSTMLRQQKTITDELRTTSLVFSTAAEGILVTAPDGQILDLNPALERMTGYARHELIGQRARTIYRLPGHAQVERVIFRGLDGQGRWSGDSILLRRDGQEVPTSVSLARIPGDQGELQGFVAVVTDVSRLKEAENKLRDLAYFDALTRLPNLRMMGEQVHLRLKTSKTPFVLLFLDLDHLKQVNDTHGHEAGDIMIRGMAEHLQGKLPPGHLLCRRSGDEFIALVDVNPETPATACSHMLKQLTCAEVLMPSGPLQVTATLGVARYPEDAQSWHELQICADVAMNAAKQASRGSVAWYDFRLGQKVMRQRQVQQRLVMAIDQEQIEVHYQPVVDLASAELVGFEALARWNDPELGAVRPSEFIAIAEDAQLSERLTLQLLKIILRDKSAIQQRFPGTVLAFNAAPRVFRDASLVNFLADRAVTDPDLLSLLEIELTETDIASSESQLLRQLQLLTGMGVRLVIDDFGKGYSSLTRLAQYPISSLKIDASFVSSLGLGRQTRIVELIVNLAQLLDLRVTAEGVETQAQREILLRMGCTRGQGWLFSKALPLEALLRLANPLPCVEAVYEEET